MEERQKSSKAIILEKLQQMESKNEDTQDLLSIDSKYPLKALKTGDINTFLNLQVPENPDEIL